MAVNANNFPSFRPLSSETGEIRSEMEKTRASVRGGHSQAVKSFSMCFDRKSATPPASSFCQPVGQTSPYFLVNYRTSTRRIISSTLRPPAGVLGALEIAHPLTSKAFADVVRGVGGGRHYGTLAVDADGQSYPCPRRRQFLAGRERGRAPASGKPGRTRCAPAVAGGAVSLLVQRIEPQHLPGVVVRQEV